MKILVITWNFPPRRGGIEYVMRHVCAGLRRNHSVFVITSYAKDRSADHPAIFRPRWPGLPIFFVYALLQGTRLLYGNGEIKVVLGGSVLVTPVVLFLSRLFRRKAVVLAHGLDIVYPDTLYQALCVWWLKFCDRVIANSRYTAGLAEERRVPKASICAIPPGVDVETFCPGEISEAKKALAVEGRKVLLYVGRMARRKGVTEFVGRSLPKIVARVPEVCFVIVGENPTESLTHREDVMGELMNVIKESGLQNHVRLLGWLKETDLVKVYQACDLMVLPARSMPGDAEGFGIVLLEAAAAGKPAIATRIAGIPDALEEGKSGILVAPEDYNSLSDAIVKMLRDDETRLAVGAYARRRVEERFSWDKVLAKYERALSEW